MLVLPDGMEKIAPQGSRPIVGMVSIMTEVGSSLLLMVVVLLFCCCFVVDLLLGIIIIFSQSCVWVI